MATVYEQAKLEALTLLDDATQANLVANYGSQYSATTLMFKGLGIPPERLAVMSITVNTALKKYPNSRKLTSAALVGCRTVGDYIKLYCGGAAIKVPAGEPK